MTTLAQNTRIRVAAALILLLLRPCVIFLSAEFLSSQSGRHARIEYIDNDLAIQNLATSRNPMLAMHRAAHSTGAPLTSGVSLQRMQGFRFTLSQREYPRILEQPVALPDTRAPPIVIA